MAQVPSSRTVLVVSSVLGLPLLFGADGCRGSFTSTDPAPNVAGTWDVVYADSFAVDITLGGAHYVATVPATGGTAHVDHAGLGFDFMIDCSRPEVICPSEVWPERVTVDQRDATYRHRVWVTIPSQTCSVPLRDPDPATCGEGTPNPDCDRVCDGEVTTTTHDAFGLVDVPGEHFDLLLGGGAASNGLNCVLLGLSVAEADLVNTGSSAAPETWETVAMENGEVRTGYAGGCLWAGDPSMTGEVQALVLGATIEISVPFTAARVD